LKLTIASLCLDFERRVHNLPSKDELSKEFRVLIEDGKSLEEIEQIFMCNWRYDGAQHVSEMIIQRENMILQRENMILQREKNVLKQKIAKVKQWAPDGFDFEQIEKTMSKATFLTKNALETFLTKNKFPLDVIDKILEQIGITAEESQTSFVGSLKKELASLPEQAIQFQDFQNRVNDLLPKISAAFPGLAGKSIFVRECFADLLDIILTLGLERNIGITGDPGIGKVKQFSCNCLELFCSTCFHASDQQEGKGCFCHTGWFVSTF
jgi:hypothetical protein